jgi:hypothetical protein
MDLMALFDKEAVFIVEHGRRARRLAADVSDPASCIVAVSNTVRGDGVWMLDVIGDPNKAWVGRAWELNGPTREVKDGNLSRAFPYMVDGGRGRGLVLVEEVADVHRMLRSAGADMTLVFTLAIEELCTANAELDVYRNDDMLRDAAKRSAKSNAKD